MIPDSLATIGCDHIMKYEVWRDELREKAQRKGNKRKRGKGRKERSKRKGDRRV